MTNGESLSIGSVFFKNDTIYLYDLADRRLVSFDKTGTFLKAVPLASIGRFTYVGDDFVILNSKAIFLNTVDKSLELFDLENGRHIGSIKYPHNIFKEAPKRSHRIINRIYIDGRFIVLGNSHRLFYFDLITRQVEKEKDFISANTGSKILFFNGSKTLFTFGDNSIADNKRQYIEVKSEYSLSGKQYFYMNDRLYALSLDQMGWYIMEVE